MIDWRSKLQPKISESTAEAELRALTEGINESLVIALMEEELCGYTVLPIIAYEDNEATVNHCNSNVHKSRMKHLEVTIYKSNERVRDGTVHLQGIHSENQLADFPTKPLDRKNY